MIVARFRDAIRVAREALEVAAAADLPLIEGHARNTLGFSLAMTGEVDEAPPSCARRSGSRASTTTSSDLAVAYDNYADMLHVLGRSDEARAVAAEGRKAVAGRRPISMLWLDMHDRRARVRRRRMGRRPRPACPTPQPLDRDAVARRASCCGGPRWPLGAGDHAAAAALLRRARAARRGLERAAGRWGRSAVLVAELRRRDGRPRGGARRRRRWLERIDALQRRRDRRSARGRRWA